MDKKIFICASIIIVFAVIAIFARNNLEIVQRRTITRPSSEVLANPYYAMDSWLRKTGHSVRIGRHYNPSRIAEISENVAVVFASSSDWKDAEKFLIPWIKRGNFLTICLDYENGMVFDENLGIFLSSLGFADNIRDVQIVNDFKLLDLYIGEGKITVTGNPWFMQNDYLRYEEHARIVWELTAGRVPGTSRGIVFIRTRHTANTIFGRIMERGNLIPVIVSALIVIFLGFWMVVPVFGLVFDEKQKSSRPIRDRFAAETNFLKKYNALDYYLDKHDIQKKGQYNYKEIIYKLRSNYGTN